MGGRPLYAVLGLALPRTRSRSTGSSSSSRDSRRPAGAAGVVLVGGDLSQSRKVAISVTVIGEAGRVVLRSGARPGDHIFVSGCLGDAKQGLLLYKKGHRLGENRTTDFFLKAFLDPKPQTALGRELARLRAASAMIDCSDGLSVDLNHICEASGAGAEIDPLRRSPSPGPERLPEGALFRWPFTAARTSSSSSPSGRRPCPRLESLRKKFRLTDIGRIVRREGDLDRGCPRPPQGRSRSRASSTSNKLGLGADSAQIFAEEDDLGGSGLEDASRSPIRTVSEPMLVQTLTLFSVRPLSMEATAAAQEPLPEDSVSPDAALPEQDLDLLPVDDADELDVRPVGEERVGFDLLADLVPDDRGRGRSARRRCRSGGSRR